MRSGQVGRPKYAYALQHTDVYLDRERDLIEQSLPG